MPSYLSCRDDVNTSCIVTWRTRRSKSKYNKNLIIMKKTMISCILIFFAIDTVSSVSTSNIRRRRRTETNTTSANQQQKRQHNVLLSSVFDHSDQTASGKDDEHVQILLRHQYRQQQQLNGTNNNDQSNGQKTKQIIFLVAIIVLLCIAGIMTIGWLVIIYLRCKYAREERKEALKKEKQQKLKQRELERRNGNNNNKKNSNYDENDEPNQCCPNSPSKRSDAYTKDHHVYHKIKQYNHHKLNSQSSHAATTTSSMTTPSSPRSPRFPIPLKRHDFESPYTSSGVVKNNKPIPVEFKFSRGFNDNDSFAAELEMAKQADHENYIQHLKQQQHPYLYPYKRYSDNNSATPSNIPKLSPSKKDIAPMQLMDYVKDSFLMYNNNNNNKSPKNQHQFHQNQQRYNPQAFFDQQQNNTMNRRVYQDPDTFLALASTSDSTNTSLASSSYGANHFSTDEGDEGNAPFHTRKSQGRPLVSSVNNNGQFMNPNYHDQGGKDGFHVMRSNQSDEMNTYISSNQHYDNEDDSSFGNNSGMEMSLGGSHRSTSTITSSVARQGFHTIHDDNQMMFEYIPRDEYNAAVLAAASIINRNGSSHNHDYTPRISNAIRKSKFDHDDMQHAPSDELVGNYLPRDLDSTTTASENRILGTIATNSSSVTVSSGSLISNSLGDDSEPMIMSSSSGKSTNIFKELKNVSIFLKRYEKKKQKRKKYGRKGIVSITSFPLSSNADIHDDNYARSHDNSIDLSNSTSSDEQQPLSKNRKDKVSDVVRTINASKRQNKTKFDMSSSTANPAKRPDKLPIPNMPNDAHHRLESNELGRGMMSVTQRTHPIGMNPSMDSVASDTNFLESEIKSFFSHKDVSTLSSSIMSNSITGTTASIDTNNSKGVISNEKKNNLLVNNQSDNSVDIYDDSVSNHRLGAAPYDPSEHERHNAIHKSNQSINNEIEGQVPKSASTFIGEKAQNLRSMVESKLENGAVSLVSIFNAKRSTTPSASESTRKRVTFTDVNDEKKTEYAGRHENKESVNDVDSMISPTIINVVHSRKGSVKPLNIVTQQESGDAQVEGVKSEGKSTSLAGRISPTINATARSLITMFESKKSSTSPITPQNEYWQYTGKLKTNNR